MPSNKEDGARIILKSRYVKARRNHSGGTGTYAQYIGTREGVVKITDSQRNNEQTKNQQKFINELLGAEPNIKYLPAYADYKAKPTLGRASDLIDDAMDNYGYKLQDIDGYAEYMATRPMANKTRNTGLFSSGNDPVDMKTLKEELQNYNGNVYLPIISLREKDSIELGYDNPKAWHDLIERHLKDFSREYRIPIDRLRWVGAYHNAENSDGVVHNHVHLMLWSTDPHDGWQDKNTGTNLKNVLARDIFKNELHEINIQKGIARDKIRSEAKEKIDSILEDLISNSSLKNSDLIANEMNVLADRLKESKGRKYYNYLSPANKHIVDNIVNDLVETDPRIKDMLNSYADYKDRQIRIYTNDHYELPPLSQINEFKPIKNAVIKAAVQLSKEKEKAEYALKQAEKSAEYKEIKQKMQDDMNKKAINSALSSLSKLMSNHTKGGTNKQGKAHYNEEDIEQLHKLGLK